MAPRVVALIMVVVGLCQIWLDPHRVPGEAKPSLSRVVVVAELLQAAPADASASVHFSALPWDRDMPLRVDGSGRLELPLELPRPPQGVGRLTVRQGTLQWRGEGSLDESGRLDLGRLTPVVPPPPAPPRLPAAATPLSPDQAWTGVFLTPPRRFQ